jgi:serine/threonine-protein kinase
VREIGRGGMGAVYLAQDSRLERKVAIKFLSANAIESQDRFNHFRQEARSISALNHPNIITIYDFGYLDGFAALAARHGDTLCGLNCQELQNTCTNQSVR